MTSAAVPPDVRTVQIPSTADGAAQPAILFVPKAAHLKAGGKPAPLLVALHTWSSGYKSTNVLKPCLARCRKLGWVMIHPHFRGPNWTPQACGSDLAVRDVLDSVRFAMKAAKVDPRRIYLVGASGGGHMAMLMAGRSPKLWAGVSAWVGISDLAAWHAECKKAKRKYYRDLEKAFGGPPDTEDRKRAYRHRSPLTYLPNAAGVSIDLNTGIHDGHTGSVPVSHSLRAFNVLAVANGRASRRISDAQIAFMLAKRRIPDALAGQRTLTNTDTGRAHRVLFRREAGPARITVFEGGHEADYHAAFAWLETQRLEGDAEFPATGPAGQQEEAKRRASSAAK